MELKQHGDGTCRTPIYDPSYKLRLMNNQDVVIMYAKEGYFKIVDAFTPSRATPRADAHFTDADGTPGTDDIIDAIGTQRAGRLANPKP